MWQCLCLLANGSDSLSCRRTFIWMFTFLVVVNIPRPSESQLSARKVWLLGAYLTERLRLETDRTNEAFERQLELLDVQFQAMEIVRTAKPSNLNVSRLIMLLSLPSPLKPDAKWTNEDVVEATPTGDAPTTSEWSAILLPTKVPLIIEVWRYYNNDAMTWKRIPHYWPFAWGIHRLSWIPPKKDH